MPLPKSCRILRRSPLLFAFEFGEIYVYIKGGEPAARGPHAARVTFSNGPPVYFATVTLNGSWTYADKTRATSVLCDGRRWHCTGFNIRQVSYWHNKTTPCVVQQMLSLKNNVFYFAPGKFICPRTLKGSPPLAYMVQIFLIWQDLQITTPITAYVVPTARYKRAQFCCIW